MNKENAELASVVSIALLIREAFPELNNRAFAVMEATLTKENMPNLPLCFVALLGMRGMNQSNNVSTPLDLQETICVEFWIASKNYKREDGSASPFYAYQDYQKTMNRLFEALSGYFTPQGKRVRFISLDTSTDEYCLTLSFKFSVEWRWCAEPDSDLKPVRIKASFQPDLVYLTNRLNSD